MNIREKIERIEALEAECYERFKALKALKAEVLREDEFPQDGDNYWYINPLGIIMRDKWSGFVSEGHMTEIGNVFQTEQQAQFAAEKLKVEGELWKFSRPFEYGKTNYHFFFDIDGNSFRTNFTSYCPLQGAIYFESEEKAKQAISTVGVDRIKKYIFEVED